ncbi:uncharacterized protein DFL_008841 [Arthrobotrys flagrans]|uniref:ABM domain-containing protein n=1 Tax=Arthrobotrys flagrans TaxID=97331 RepID=A0A436ZPY1_ARTFL|nr:hypothetical protein DFL_008841 [Arthrobotrys flagrans]
MVTTEICIFTLDSITLPDLLSPEKVHQSSLSTVRSQPGCQNIYWGIGIQDPLKLFWFIEWDSLSSHRTFQSLPAYPSFVSTALTLTSPSSPLPISVLHFDFPTPPSALFPRSSQKPYLEYFSFPVLPNTHDLISSVLSTLRSALSTYDGQGGIDSTYGFAIDHGRENDCVSLISWKSKEQHEAFLQTEAFGQAAPKMREVAAGPPVAIHVDLQEWE